MKPFDLEAAKAGAPIQTRDGNKARIICFDRTDSSYPIVASVTFHNGEEGISSYTSGGQYYPDRTYRFDLVMASIKKEGWIPMINGCPLQCKIYSNKEDAEQFVKDCGVSAIVAHIEYEE